MYPLVKSVLVVTIFFPIPINNQVCSSSAFPFQVPFYMLPVSIEEARFYRQREGTHNTKGKDGSELWS